MKARLHSVLKFNIIVLTFNLSRAGGAALGLQCGVRNGTTPRKMLESALLAQVVCSFGAHCTEKSVDQYLSFISRKYL